MSVDAYNNFVVRLSADALLPLLDASRLSLWIDEKMHLAKECNAIIVCLYGAAAGLVANFRGFGFTVRGWIVEADAGDGYLELSCPILIDNIPPYKTARVGVLIALSVGDRFIVVKERFGPPLFKFVTGAVESGEAPLDAAVRELREELGIRVEKDRFALKAIHLEKQARVGVDDYCFVYHCCADLAAAAEPKLQTQEILEMKSVSPAEPFESDTTLTLYTKTLINQIHFKKQPTAVVRGKKELVSFKLE